MSEALKANMRVLLIEDDPVDVEAVARALPQSPEIRLVRAEKLSVGLDHLRHGAFDVILLDFGLPDSQGLETLRAVRARAPDVPIVVLTGNDDDALGLAAVREGAQEFLPKGESRNGSLMRTIRFAIQRRSQSAQGGRGPRPVKQGMVIGFIGAKGGVGSSTVSLNVALALAKTQRAVTAAELRPGFGTFALKLKLNPTVNLGTLFEGSSAPADASQLRDRLKKMPLVQLPSGLRVLFGPQRAEHYRPVEAPQVEALVQCLAETSDYLVLDLPPGPSAVNRAAVSRCHRLVLVLERETSCVEAARALLKLLATWEGIQNVAGAVIVNRVPVAVPLDLAELRARLDCPILGVIPPAPDLCYAALRRGSPLVLSEPDHAVSAALSELAQRVAADRVRPIEL